MVISLELSDVGVHYGRTRVLEGVSTPSMTGGELVAVIGPNAAGKSTLLRRIAGLVGGTGSVRVTGRSRIAGREAPRVSYLPQETAVNAVLTVYESVLLALKQGGAWSVGDDKLGRIEAALRALDIEHLAFRNIGELSGGQRQLVSLAQTVAREPDVMLLDEPTSALDLRHEFEVLALVREMTRALGIVALVSIHDLDQALGIADKTLVLSNGRVAGFGPPQKVITPELLASVYGVVAKVQALAEGGSHVAVVGTT